MAALLTALVWAALHILLIGFLGIAAVVEEGLYWADWCAEDELTEL